MIHLTKLAALPIVLFALFILIVFTQIFFVIWYRRRFRRQNSATGHPKFPGDAFSSPSKELLYFFCWKHQSRIEPHADPAAGPARLQQEEQEVNDVLKLQGLYGSSRVLFTIKEEEREDIEPNPADKSLPLETEDASLEECLMVADDLPELTVMIGVDQTTPFSTPCASPPYLTPPLSPVRDAGNQTNSPAIVEMGNLVLQIEGPEEECLESDVSGDSKFSFVSVEFHSD